MADKADTRVLSPKGGPEGVGSQFKLECLIRVRNMPEKDLSSSHDVRRLSPAEVKKLNKDQLVFALRTLIEEPTSETEAGPQTVQIARIETKLDNMLSRWDRERSEMQTEMKSLRQDNKKIAEAIAQHQRMLEILESDKRAGNLIIMGLPEEGMEGA